jgi:hypothetical protein
MGNMHQSIRRELAISLYDLFLQATSASLNKLGRVFCDFVLSSLEGPLKELGEGVVVLSEWDCHFLERLLETEAVALLLQIAGDIFDYDYVFEKVRDVMRFLLVYFHEYPLHSQRNDMLPRLMAAVQKLSLEHGRFSESDGSSDSDNGEWDYDHELYESDDET